MTEPAVKVVTNVTDAMRSQPLALGMLLVNILWIGFFVWFALNLRDRNEAERAYFHAVIEKCYGMPKA